MNKGQNDTNNECQDDNEYQDNFEMDMAEIREIWKAFDTAKRERALKALRAYKEITF